jgi:hypothetical protein
MREKSSIINTYDEKELELWYKANNIIDEYCELFEDFIIGLYYIIDQTYLGPDSEVGTETNITLNDQDIRDHFDWCWKKNIDNFKKENILFEEEGDHKAYFNQFFNETYYYQSMIEIKESIPVFFSELFESKTVDTQINLQMIIEIYKNLYKSLQKTNKPNF